MPDDVKCTVFVHQPYIKLHSTFSSTLQGVYIICTLCRTPSRMSWRPLAGAGQGTRSLPPTEIQSVSKVWGGRSSSLTHPLAHCQSLMASSSVVVVSADELLLRCRRCGVAVLALRSRCGGGVVVLWCCGVLCCGVLWWRGVALRRQCEGFCGAVVVVVVVVALWSCG